MRGEWWLDHRMVAVHQPTNTLLVADLHLGYLVARRESGEAIPAESLADELTALDSAWRDLNPAQIVIAGDLMERSNHGLLVAFAEWAGSRKIKLAGLVPGNHDSNLRNSPIPILQPGHQVGNWHVWHDDATDSLPIVHGHRHPAIALPGHGMAPCFVYLQDRLVLPAYSTHAAGGSITRRSIFPWDSAEVIASAGKRLESLGTIETIRSVLSPDKKTRRRL